MSKKIVAFGELIWDIFSDGKNNFQIVKAKRIGIAQAQHELLRFYIKNNNFVSVKTIM